VRKTYRGEHKNGNIEFQFFEHNSALVDFWILWLGNLYYEINTSPFWSRLGFPHKALAKRTRKWTQVLNLSLPATRFGQGLRALAMTWAHFGRDQICTQVDARPKSAQVKWRPLINLILKWVFCDFCVLGRKLASPFGYGHPTHVSTQAQLVATCDYLRVRLTSA